MLNANSSKMVKATDSIFNKAPTRN